MMIYVTARCFLNSKFLSGFEVSKKWVKAQVAYFLGGSCILFSFVFFFFNQIAMVKISQEKITRVIISVTLNFKSRL